MVGHRTAYSDRCEADVVMTSEVGGISLGSGKDAIAAACFQLYRGRGSGEKHLICGHSERRSNRLWLQRQSLAIREGFVDKAARTSKLIGNVAYGATL